MRNIRDFECWSCGPAINALVGRVFGVYWCLPALILLLLLPNANTQAQILQGTEEAEAAGYLPPVFPGPWVTIELRDIHPNSGHDPQRLGDINGDGYDDFAFRSISQSDTIYVYLGDTIISPAPYLLLPGGGSGLVSGDFNGDGYIDLAASVHNVVPDSVEFGRIYIYLHHGQGSKPEYGPEADFVIVGDSVYWGWGATGNPPMTTGDFDGDGYADLAFHSVGPISPGIGKFGSVVLIKGAREFRAEASEIFWEHDDPWTGPKDGLWAADITGDGKDELFAQGIRMQAPQVMFIYAGTSDEQIGASFDAVILPEMDPICATGTVLGLNFVDVNNDGVKDIIGWDGTGPTYPERSIIWGKPTLPVRFTKDALYPNPDPEKRYLINCFGAYPLGDIDGDGVRDYSVAYTVGSIVLWTNFIYSGRLGWQTKALAYYGMDQEVSRVSGKPVDIGDVNGDGYDDILHGAYGGGGRFRIFLGRNMNPTSVELPPEAPAIHLELYPNPARIGDAVRVNISGVETGELRVYDMLGRLMLHRQMLGGTILESAVLTAGMYVALLHTMLGSARSMLVLY